MTADEAMRRIDALVSHIWMVRTFVKHSEEAEDDDELMDVVRTLYDFCLALGPAWTAQDSAEYLKLVRKKYAGLREAAAKFAELQPQVSDHTNYKMAVRSLAAAIDDIGSVLSAATANM
ncbi:MAG: amidohydrolase [Planctomycetia bacterium 21-64-5]|nr:MAG: amidohydrolase [Planctomycetia bacterium 21-64-5]HQU46448.1 amidohydrolase [Pirellulales bacterium]